MQIYTTNYGGYSTAGAFNLFGCNDQAAELCTRYEALQPDNCAIRVGDPIAMLTGLF